MTKLLPAGIGLAGLTGVVGYQAASSDSAGASGALLLIALLAACAIGGWSAGPISYLAVIVGVLAIGIAGAVSNTPPSDFDESWPISLAGLLVLAGACVAVGTSLRTRRRRHAARHQADRNPLH
jgi:hypothetical protein